MTMWLVTSVTTQINKGKIDNHTDTPRYQSRAQLMIFLMKICHKASSDDITSIEIKDKSEANNL
jgi:hypothetical protein